MPIDLMTAEGEALLASGKTPWTAYPRPQMKRDSYVNLNGQWDFTVTPGGNLPRQYDKKIRKTGISCSTDGSSLCRQILTGAGCCFI